MGGVRMSEDEGDEKERSIILLCFKNPTHARAKAHVISIDTYTCTYINLCMVMSTCTPLKCTHCVHTLCLFLLHARTHARTHAQPVERSQCSWHLVPLAAHTFITQSWDWQNPLPHRPWVHTYTQAYTLLYTLTHIHRQQSERVRGRMKRHQQYY